MEKGKRNNEVVNYTERIHANVYDFQVGFYYCNHTMK